MNAAAENDVRADVEEQIPTFAKMFAFDIPPEVKAGVTMKVKAPDGIVLHIPLPASVHARDRLCMEKNLENGKWSIKHVERAQAPPPAPAPDPAPAISVEPNGQVTRRSDMELERDLSDANVCLVRLATTKGDINIKIVPSWAPEGVKRFLELVTNQYYSELAIYRSVPKFLVQFGITNDTKRSDRYEAIPDDLSRGVPITDGCVCFAASGPNTRNATLCIFLASFKQLGWNSWETPIGKVCPESVEVLHSIYTGYGDMPQCGGCGPDPVQLEKDGNAYIQKAFPECDFVKSAEWIRPAVA